MFDLLCFVLATLSFLFMYHFHQAVAVAEKGPQGRKCYQPKPQGKLDHIRDSFTTFQSVSEAMLKAGVRKARLVLGIDLTASNEWQGGSHSTEIVSTSYTRSGCHKSSTITRKSSTSLEKLSNPSLKLAMYLPMASEMWKPRTQGSAILWGKRMLLAGTSEMCWSGTVR